MGGSLISEAFVLSWVVISVDWKLLIQGRMDQEETGKSHRSSLIAEETHAIIGHRPT